MGVSLSLDGARPRRRRTRGGQHSRSPEEQACLDALAAFLRSDAPGATRYLGKVPRADLADRLLPAARALARAADLVLASDAAADRAADLDRRLLASPLGTGSPPGTSVPPATASLAGPEAPGNASLPPGAGPL